MNANPTLDDELEGTRLYLLQLKRRKNSLAPVSRLPVEILAHIFSYFPASDLHPHERTSQPPSWLAITHVCHHWRETSLSFPSLWTNIMVTNCHWTQETLARSKEAPISITINWKTGKQPVHEAALSVLAEAHRARSIEIHADMVSRYVHQLTRMPALHLESLTLMDYTHHCYFDDGPLFKSQIPKLRFLRMVSCQFSWTDPVFQSTLVELEITKVLPNFRPTVQELADLLSRLPNLERILLAHALPCPPPGFTVASCTSSSVSRVFLPQAKFVSFAASSALELLFALSILQLPRDARVIMGLQQVLDPDEDLVLALIHILLAQTSLRSGNTDGTTVASSPAAASFHTLSVHSVLFPHTQGWGLSLDDTVLPEDSPFSPLLTHVAVTSIFSLFILLSDTAQSSRLSERFFILAGRLPLFSTIESVSVDCDLFADPARCWRVFGRLKKVNKLLVRQQSTRGFLRALCERPVDEDLEDKEEEKEEPGLPRQDEAETFPLHLFPCLQYLTVDTSDLCASPGNDTSESESEPAKTVLDTLRAMLNQRCASKDHTVMVPVREMAIRECDVMDGCNMDFGDVEVEWDGKVDGWTKNREAHAAAMADILYPDAG